MLAWYDPLSVSTSVCYKSDIKTAKLNAGSNNTTRQTRDYTAFLTPKIVVKSIGSSPRGAPHAPVGDDPMDFTTIFGVRKL